MEKSVFIIHSRGQTLQAAELAEQLRSEGYRVYVPGKQTKQDTDELSIATENREAMKNADEVRIFWDGTSHGVIFDLGMAFAMQKKIKLEYADSKSMRNLMELLNQS